MGSKTGSNVKDEPCQCILCRECGYSYPPEMIVGGLYPHHRKADKGIARMV